MFRKNTRYLQIPLISHVDELPEPLRQRLRNSWAETFYREFFCRLDKAPFAVLYADTPSRPNVPVNVLVALEFLKAANGWTNEELYDHACYDVQVRYAVGCRQLGEGYFDLRTLYYFRERLARRRQRSAEHRKAARNRRAAVEATVRSLKHPFPAGKLPVRGRFRVTCMVLGAAAVVNVRLHRYLQAKIAGERAGTSVQSGKNRLQERAREAFFLCFAPSSRSLASLGCAAAPFSVGKVRFLRRSQQ